MAAAPRTGGLVYLGQSGRRYNVSAYVSDVLAGFVTFSMDGAAVAGSQNFWIAPENVTLVDFSIATGLTDTTCLKVLVNDTPLGQILLHANHVNTLPGRSIPGIGIAAGRKVTLIQA